ncbi:MULTISPECIES: TetR/AcrR family transcriptional regulator [unclassified Parafrankia]|uniref:TetR/AcrR family transcriptional regulator n=1 Tax=unclassified Parafrankia TaxID=2994368 RepID=UPI000DA56A98|nr:MULTISPECIES: TetR/AcrR family transcriptional regulator [unclassified Parafrankia]TCJ31330.1 TetR/AcrR family transcriptional regulator [Parafrankia sp. BMG5.11]SQD96728.1 Transcriptional regulator, TetR family [Parafrankia sp. Ea1.12]
MTRTGAGPGAGAARAGAGAGAGPGAAAGAGAAADSRPDGGGGPRSRRGAETRARLVEAAKAVFEEKGYHDTRVADIAERASVSHGSFYHYFDSKDQIFREVAAVIDAALSAGMAIILARNSSMSPHERLTEAIRVHFEAYRAEARIMSVIEQVSRHDEQVYTVWTQLFGRHSDDVARSIEQLQRHRLADPDLDPAVTSAALGAMMWRFAEQWLVQGQPVCDFDVGIAQITRLFVNALQLRDPTGIPHDEPRRPPAQPGSTGGAGDPASSAHQ